MAFPPLTGDGFTALREQLHAGARIIDPADSAQRTALDVHIVLFATQLEYWDEFDERVERLRAKPAVTDDDAVLKLHLPVALMRYHLATSQRTRGLQFAHHTIESQETSYAVHAAMSAVGTWHMRAEEFPQALLCLVSATDTFRSGDPDEFVSGPICSLAWNLATRGIAHPAVTDALRAHRVSGETRARAVGFEHSLSLLETEDECVADWWLL